jgi:SOS-response transcriptional repressor LexA
MVLLSEIIEKLKDVISENIEGKKVFDKDVANALHIPQSTFATMKKRNSIPYEEILQFCAAKKISVNWLFFDQAVDMLKENFETITVDEKVMHNMVGLGNTDLEAIHVDGESMEPTLQDGSIVFVDRTQSNINKDGIFIASTTAGLFIKRIRQRADGMVELISDNKNYSPEVLAPDEVSIVGKVVGNIESL